MEQFGYTVNAKGFKVLPPQVRVLQGDGMDIDKIRRLLICMHDRGLSIENIAVGMVVDSFKRWIVTLSNTP